MLPGGGSLPGTPPSVTCSVHADPDQYRFSWRPEGSISQPGGIPVDPMLLDERSAPSDACLGAVVSVNALGAEGLCGPCLRRRDGSARSAKSAAKTRRNTQEP